MKKFAAVILLSALAFVACDEGTTYTNEGSTDWPVEVTVGAPHSATIAPYGESYYWFNAPSMANYTISLQNLDSDLDWWLYSDPDFWVDVDSSTDFGSGDETKTVYLGVGDFYLEVWEWDGVGQAFTVSITVP